MSTVPLERKLEARLPFFYGWVIVAVAFVTMAVGVNARTAFSLLLPPIIDEFGWGRGATAGAFSFGFLVTAVASPFLGRLMDRRGPRIVIEIGVGLVAAGLILGSLIRELSCAFSGVGVGSIILLPWLQHLIEHGGWRAACWWLGIVVLGLLAPLNLLLKQRPEDLGLEPDGDRSSPEVAASNRMSNVVDPAWVAIDWTLARSIRTARFWWIAIGYLSGLYAWYAVQVHQTKYLLEIGFSASQAAWALGLVSVVAVPGQIALGHLSDRVGREWVWTVGNLGFMLCYLALLLLRQAPTPMLLAFMIVVQGMLGYGLVSVIGAIPADIFQGGHYGSIFGSLMLAAIVGGAAGPWATGALYDATGGYRVAFLVAIGCSALSAGTIWVAAPRKVRAVAGRIDRLT